jgi:hypothetical protein
MKKLCQGSLKIISQVINRGKTLKKHLLRKSRSIHSAIHQRMSENRIITKGTDVY